MNNSIVQSTLITMWILGFILCLIPVIIATQDIPDLYIKFQNQILDTYSPQLATMLAFIFSDSFSKQRKKTFNKFTAGLAIILSGFYILFFLNTILKFHLEELNASQAIEVFESIRPKISFLITGIIAYYFASRS